MTEQTAMTYEQRQAIEKQKADAARALILAVGKLYGWKPEKKDEREMSGYARETFNLSAHGYEGLRLHASTSAYEKWRITWRPWFPGGSDVTPFGYGERGPEVTTSSERSAQQVAEDIKRRLFGDMFRLHGVCLEKMKARDEYKAALLANMKRLHPKAEAREIERSEFTRYAGEHIWVNVKVSRDDVRLELHSVPLDVAEKILALLPKEARA